MTEETPGFDEKPDVPSGATPDDAEPQAASEEGAAPAGTRARTRAWWPSWTRCAPR
ncbi:hypothetical protein SVIOM342S_01061 [Streptomyces violaceorubidus]